VTAHSYYDSVEITRDMAGGHTVVPGLSVSGLTKVAVWTVLGSKAISTATTVASMISDFDNAARIWAGKYYSDDNISFGGQLMQGLSRSTWEILQSWGGYNYSQIRNIAGDVDRVDYLGGATFVTNEGAAGGAWGVSLGNYLNLNINGGIIGSFSEWVTNNPLYMHEYGHTFDSRGYGPAYLFKVGIPSARSAKRSTQISGEPQGVETHDFQWYEMNANRYAARYFGRYYGVNWNRPFGLPGDTI